MVSQKGLVLPYHCLAKSSNLLFAFPCINFVLIFEFEGPYSLTGLLCFAISSWLLGSVQNNPVLAY